MNTIERNRFAVFLMALALGGMTGCSLPKASKLFSLDSTWPWKDKDEPQVEVPTRVVAMWTDTVLNKAGQRPQRGFGGRLYFYGKDANKPALVDGELVVYAFDESGREQTDNKPTRRYVFPADQVTLHQSESPVGPSYSFWLPWDEAGGPRTEVSLLCRFQPKGGPVVISEQSRQLLPGSILSPTAAAAHAPPKLPEGVPSRPATPQLSSQLTSQAMNGLAASGAQQASYEVPATNVASNAAGSSTANAAQPASGMATTSITLPRDFEVPRGAAPISSAAPRNPAPAQPHSATSEATFPPSAAMQNQSGTPPAGRSVTAFQTGARPVSPAVYRPTYGAEPNSHGINQPLQVPTPSPINPPSIVPPQSATSPAQAFHEMHELWLQQQAAAQQANGSPSSASPQGVPQLSQLPTSATPAVSYR